MNEGALIPTQEDIEGATLRKMGISLPGGF
jgi:hypothetical protein